MEKKLVISESELTALLMTSSAGLCLIWPARIHRHFVVAHSPGFFRGVEVMSQLRRVTDLEDTNSEFLSFLRRSIQSDGFQRTPSLSLLESCMTYSIIAIIWEISKFGNSENISTTMNISSVFGNLAC